MILIFISSSFLYESDHLWITTVSCQLLFGEAKTPNPAFSVRSHLSWFFLAAVSQTLEHYSGLPGHVVICQPFPGPHRLSMTFASVFVVHFAQSGGLLCMNSSNRCSCTFFSMWCHQELLKNRHFSEVLTHYFILLSCQMSLAS